MNKDSIPEYEVVVVSDPSLPHVTAITVESATGNIDGCLSFRHNHCCRVLVKLAVIAIVAAFICCHTKINNNGTGMRGFMQQMHHFDSDSYHEGSNQHGWRMSHDHKHHQHHDSGDEINFRKHGHEHHHMEGPHDHEYEHEHDLPPLPEFLHPYPPPPGHGLLHPYPPPIPGDYPHAGQHESKHDHEQKKHHNEKLHYHGRDKGQAPHADDVDTEIEANEDDW